MARVLQVCNTSFYLDKFLAPLVRALREAGHEVDVACEGTSQASLGDGVRVFPFEFPRTGSPLAFASAISRMRELIRRGHYDCVDSHNRNGSIVGRVAGWLERVPSNVYTAHGFYFHDDQSPLAHRSTVGLEALLARITDYTLSQSAEDTSWMVKRGFIRDDRIEHIGNGIDTRRFHPRPSERASVEAELGLPSPRFRIASTGRLVRGKGFGDLLEAFARFHARHPASELVIIGGNIDQDIDSFAREFEAKAAQLGVSDALRVTGLTSRVPDYLATVDVFVLPSYREGLPRALIEAMSAGIPVLATNIRGCREAVADGDSGLLFEPHDVDGLAAALERVHDDEVLARRLATNGRARAVGHFDERDYVARQVQAIDRLVGRPFAGPR